MKSEMQKYLNSQELQLIEAMNTAQEKQQKQASTFMTKL